VRVCSAISVLFVQTDGEDRVPTICMARQKPVRWAQPSDDPQPNSAREPRKSLIILRRRISDGPAITSHTIPSPLTPCWRPSNPGTTEPFSTSLNPWDDYLHKQPLKPIFFNSPPISNLPRDEALYIPWSGSRRNNRSARCLSPSPAAPSWRRSRSSSAISCLELD
jgi:hypothetical protein